MADAPVDLTASETGRLFIWLAAAPDASNDSTR